MNSKKNIIIKREQIDIMRLYNPYRNLVCGVQCSHGKKWNSETRCTREGKAVSDSVSCATIVYCDK